MTWGMTGAPGARNTDADGGVGCAEDCWGSPHRTHVAADAGFMPPHDAHRM